MVTLDFCGQRSPQLVVAEGNNIFEVRETHICGRGPPQMVVGESHNILVVTESLFVAGGRHIYLWQEATKLSKSHVPTKIGTYGPCIYK